ncbi:hypothetical protein [Timonella sp. A28]|uniref:hypothetical protein n=1 Tax=Timonella sp. A28 TaxID=3442640 RepID=UPI003EBE54B4
MGLFRRKQTVSAIPAGVTEYWSDEDTSVVVSIPFDASGRDESHVADDLSNAVIATIGGIQSGDFGHCIPEGVSGARVKVEVNTGGTVLGPLSLHTLDILRERLGKSMSIDVKTDPQAVEAAEKAREEEAKKPTPGMPELPKYDADGKKLSIWQSMKLAAEQQAQAANTASDSAASVSPREDLSPAVFTWNETDGALRADIVVLGEAGADAQTQADVSHLVERTLGSLNAAETLAVVPDGASGYDIQLTVAVNEDAAGPLTLAKLEQGENQFAGTRVDFVVIVDSRSAIEEMIAE